MNGSYHTQCKYQQITHSQSIFQVKTTDGRSQNVFSKLSLFLWVMQKTNRLKLLDVLRPKGGLHLIQALERGLSEHNLQIKNTSVSFRALSQPLYTIQEILERPFINAFLHTDGQSTENPIFLKYFFKRFDECYNIHDML